MSLLRALRARPGSAEPEEDLYFVEIRRRARVLDSGAPEAEMPDWLDFVLCIVAPGLVTAAVLLLFRLGAHLAGG